MLGQPVSMLLPQVVGFKLAGELPEGSTATDLVLTVTQMLRERGAWSASSSSSTARAGQPRRSPTGPRSGTCRRRWAPPARSSRSTPRRSATWSSRAGRPSGSSSSRRTAASRASSTTRRRGGRLLGHARARSRRRGAVARRPEAPAGPGALSDAAEDFVASSRSTGRRRAELRRGRRVRVVPRSDPPTQRSGGERAQAGTQPPGAGHRGGRARGGLRARLRGDRGDHELHQHLEPVRDARRGLLAKKAVEAGSSASRG